MSNKGNRLNFSRLGTSSDFCFGRRFVFCHTSTFAFIRQKHTLKIPRRACGFSAGDPRGLRPTGAEDLVVDMAKLYDNRYETLEQNAKIPERRPERPGRGQQDEQGGQRAPARPEEGAQEPQRPGQQHRPFRRKSRPKDDAQKKLERRSGEAGQVARSSRTPVTRSSSASTDLPGRCAGKSGKGRDRHVAKRKGARFSCDKAGPRSSACRASSTPTPAEITNVMTGIRQDPPAARRHRRPTPASPLRVPRQGCAARAEVRRRSTISVPGIGAKVSLRNSPSVLPVFKNPLT